MKSIIASLLVAAAASTAASAIATTPARATEYAWCGYGASQGGSQSCTFATIEQCRAYVAGGGGYCQSNPRATAFAEMPKRNQRR